MHDAVAHVAAADPAMARIIDQVPYTLARRRTSGGYFHALARAILYQQLAGKAAAAIHARFVALYDGKPTPEAVLATGDEALRAAGLSTAKAVSVKDLAAKVLDGTVRLRGISRYDDDEVVRQLTQVRGIGRWTAEMFLMFQLGRLDVWPVDDYGVRKGWALLHGGALALPTPKELAAAGEVYRPYRSVAAWYCWRAVDVSPPA